MDRADCMGESVSNFTESHILPDILQTGLRVVFCGTAAGNKSADARAYYAHGGNKFWKILFDVKIIPIKYHYSEFEKLPIHLIGLTDLFKQEQGMDHGIPIALLRDQARDSLKAKIENFQPRFLAFTSMNAAKAYFGERRAIGPQVEKIGTTTIWVLPSTSPAANRHWRPEIWQQFSDAIRCLS